MEIQVYSQESEHRQTDHINKYFSTLVEKKKKVKSRAGGIMHQA